jgi:hypothetical protein
MTAIGYLRILVVVVVVVLTLLVSVTLSSHRPASPSSDPVFTVNSRFSLHQFRLASQSGSPSLFYFMHVKEGEMGGTCITLRGGEKYI